MDKDDWCNDSDPYVDIYGKNYITVHLKDLYQFLEHGDKQHKEWLKEALIALRDGKPRPPPRNKNGLIKE